MTETRQVLCRECRRWWPWSGNENNVNEPVEHDHGVAEIAPKEYREYAIRPLASIALMSEVMDAVRHAEVKHPGHPGLRDPVRGIAIIEEEVGEAMREALDMTRDSVSVVNYAGYVDRIYGETIHIAATAVRMLLEIRRYRGENPQA